MENFTILICLFNKSIEDSNTIQSLLSSSPFLDNTKIILWDNSLTPLKEDKISYLCSKLKNLEYISTPENTPLARIYNSIIDRQKKSDGYLMICDDDSLIPVSFFQEIFLEIGNNLNINLFLPKIVANSVIVSPARDYKIFSKFFRNLKTGLIHSNNITAINSCMVISNRIFLNGFRYDLRLNFYGTDNYFMYNYTRRYQKIFVLNSNVRHSLSFNSTNDLKNKLRIFREIRRANRIVYADNFVTKNVVRLNNFIVAVKYCLRFKTLKFLYD